MTVSELRKELKLSLLTEYDGEDTLVTGCYIGDLLSWVMSKVQSGDAWLTVMGNMNAVAVASLTDAACIILCENAALDDDALKKANLHQIAIYVSEENSYQIAKVISRMMEAK